MYNTITRNKVGGCINLINYLDKENELSTEKFAQYLDKEDSVDNPEYFFNGKGKKVETPEVVKNIDGNCKGLKHSESRFYSMTLNPSAREIKHIEEQADAQVKNIINSGVDKYIQQTPKQMKDNIARDMFKEYTVKVMDKYAENFKREGINNNNDLVWYGKVENHRYWKWTAPEVEFNKNIENKINKLLLKEKSINNNTKINNLKKEYVLESDVRQGGKNIPIHYMMPKSGNNYHIHIIVSRKNKDQTMSLSPLSNARHSKNQIINGEKCTIGFNRDDFTQRVETVFDKSFDYHRLFHESYEGRKIKKEFPEKYAEAEKKYYSEKEWSHTYRKGDEKDLDSISKGSVKVGMTIAQEAGLNYVSDSIRPANTVVNIGGTGIKMIVQTVKSKKIAKETTQTVTSLYKNHIMKVAQLGRATNPALAVAGMAKDLGMAFSRGIV